MQALSGRWNYDHDRREKRTIWYYAAGALALIVDRALAGPPEIGVHKVLSDYDPYLNSR